MSQAPQTNSPLITFIVKSLNGLADAAEKIDAGMTAAARDIKESAKALKPQPRIKQPRAPKPAPAAKKKKAPVVKATPAARKPKTVARKKPAATGPNPVVVALGRTGDNFRHSWRARFATMRLRNFIVPSVEQMRSTDSRWPMTKAITSFLGAAAVGGVIGVHGYALPFVFPIAFLVGAPVIALGTFIRVVGLGLQKGPLRDRMRQISDKTVAAGTVTLLAPIIAVGAVAFASIHGALSTAEVLVRGTTATAEATSRSVLGDKPAAPAADAAARPAPRFGKIAGIFKSAGRPAAKEAAVPAADNNTAPAAKNDPAPGA